MLAAAPAAAQSDPPREPGTVYHRCRATYEGAVLRFNGADPRMSVRRRDGRVETTALPASELDRFSAGVEVDGDGSLRNLDMEWLPAGRLAWPQSWRADLHPIYLSGRLHRPFVARSATSLFEPGLLDLQLDYRSERRLNGLWAFELSPTEQRVGGPVVVAIAEIPYWAISAQLSLRWTMLEHLAEGRSRLAWRFAPATYWDRRRPRGMPVSGELDLSIMPSVIEGFRVLEARLRERIAGAREDCERRVERVLPTVRVDSGVPR